MNIEEIHKQLKAGYSHISRFEIMDDMKKLLKKVEELEAQNKRLKNAIKWALGMNGRFAVRKDGQGAFWWRTELRTRAGFKGEGDA